MSPMVQRYLKVEGDKVIVSQTADEPRKPDASEVFTVVEAGDGVYALHNAKFNRYLRIGEDGAVTVSGPRNLGDLPADWTLERLELQKAEIIEPKVNGQQLGKIVETLLDISKSIRQEGQVEEVTFTKFKTWCGEKAQEHSTILDEAEATAASSDVRVKELAPRLPRWRTAWRRSTRPWRRSATPWSRRRPCGARARSASSTTLT
eukprot:SRR837773.23619.p3 GENE.SRR837773.23619~~SRR837773.23619.p3  ORF type:complete len:214 (-),score=71.15 SRR837773.23619:224-838(-)